MNTFVFGVSVFVCVYSTQNKTWYIYKKKKIHEKKHRPNSSITKYIRCEGFELFTHLSQHPWDVLLARTWNMLLLNKFTVPVSTPQRKNNCYLKMSHCSECFEIRTDDIEIFERCKFDWLFYTRLSSRPFNFQRINCFFSSCRNWTVTIANLLSSYL